MSDGIFAEAMMSDSPSDGILITKCKKIVRRAYEMGKVDGVAESEAENKALRELVNSIVRKINNSPELHSEDGGNLAMEHDELLTEIRDQIDDYFAGKDKGDETKTI